MLFKRKNIATLCLLLLLAGVTIVLLKLPNPAPLVSAANLTTSMAEVLETDDSGIDTHGYVEYGTQRLKVRLPDGRVVSAENELRAQLEYDKKFKKGDTALVILPANLRPDEVPDGPLVARDYWRLGWACVLFSAFAILLIAFSGWTGLGALFTFFFSCLVVWKLLIPSVLSGLNPVLFSFVAVSVLTAVIIFLVAGFNKKGLSAFVGAMLGVLASLALAGLFTALMNINGGTMPSSQELLYSCPYIVSLRGIFTGAIILASSGAVMDLAMDIASGVAEVKRHNASLGFSELFKSGCRMGRAVVGTMTTTLLLAYSGGYLTLLMVFAAEGVKPMDFLNSSVVSAEIVKTLVGSFGLVAVAPFTAFASAFFFSRRETRRANSCENS